MSTLGTALERVEDAGLLMGRGRYIDDLPTAPGTGHAAILRSPHAHARLVSIDPAPALALPGVHAVVTGADARAWSTPFLVGVRQPMEHWCIATDRVRYAGEPVAIVVAEDRYRAEDALALIEVRYAPLPAIVDPEAALTAEAPVLHEGRRQQPHQRAGVPLRRAGGGLRRSRAHGRDHRALPAQQLHADRVPGSRRRLGPRRGHLRRALELPGADDAASGDGAGAQGAGAASPAALGTGFGRQLRRQAGDLPPHRRHGARGAEGRAPGQVDRGSARASAGGDIGDQPGDADRGGGGRRRTRQGAPPRPAGGLRRLPARARARDALPQPRQPHRPLPDPPPGGDQPRRRHQQDADRAQPRLRRTAALLRAGAADAARRRGARPRPAGGHPTQSGAGRCHALPRRRRRRARFRRLPRHRGARRGGRRARCVAREARRGAGGRGGSTASASPRRWSPASPTWATSPRC